MVFIDTHTHLFAEEFHDDRQDVINRSIEAGVTRMILPAIDSQSHTMLVSTALQFSGTCFATMGLHPTSVNEMPDEKIQEELSIVRNYLEEPPVRFVAIGEIGLDLYWSRSYIDQQIKILHRQIQWALDYRLPVILHTREAFPEMFKVLETYRNSGLCGVFHSFSGTIDDYLHIRELGGFYTGIGGVITYKKAHLAEVLAQMNLEDLLLETDSPYLSPVPYRGKRNESSYIPYIAEKVAEIKGVPLETVAEVTTNNAKKLFRL